MNMLTRTYEGKDLVIPKELIEKMGVKPGEVVIIRPGLVLKPRTFAPEELARRRKVLKEVSGTWSAEDEEAFRRFRQDMWATTTYRS
jgi:bifunctional DNA-binding transcriptional regulator/antitoxin component of YhaV-PrlF toxin-antitoxin module